MTKIHGVRIQPGFFKQRSRKQPEYRVGDAPVAARTKRTTVIKPKAPRAKYAMPALPLIAAVGSFVAGAGIATAAGATLGAMIVGGAMMVGAAMTVVGTVTGNQKLTKWGGILTLAGGIGAMGLSMIGGLTSAVDAAGSAASAAPGSAEALGIGVDSIDAAAGGAVADMSGNAASQVAGNVAAEATAGAAGGGMMTPPAAEVAAVSPAATSSPTAVSGVDPVTAAVAPTDPTAPLQMPAELPAAPAAKLADVSAVASPPPSAELAPLPKIESPNLWSQFQTWSKENPHLSKVLTDSASGMMSAYQNSDLRAAQTENLKSSTAANQANAERTQQEAYKLWLRNFYAQGKMPPPGSNAQNYTRQGG